MTDGSDLDAPEEFTAAQGIEEDEKIRKIQRENLTRIAHENKERRRQWALRKTQPKSKKNVDLEVAATEKPEVLLPNTGELLPSNIVEILAAREKKTLSSDSEEEAVKEKPKKRKKKLRNSGPQTILLNKIPPPQCLESSLEFLKKRKMQVSRSSAILKNADQALRLISSKGNSLSKN